MDHSRKVQERAPCPNIDESKTCNLGKCPGTKMSNKIKYYQFVADGFVYILCVHIFSRRILVKLEPMGRVQQDLWRTRNRKCSPPLHGGRPCSEETFEIGDCRNDDCAGKDHIITGRRVKQSPFITSKVSLGCATSSSF